MSWAAQQALEAGGARRILNDDSFTSAPQLTRDSLGRPRMHRMQGTCLALLVLPFAIGCHRQRPSGAEVATLDTVLVFTEQGFGTFPQVTDSSRLLPHRSFRFNPTAAPCPLKKSAEGWSLAQVALPTATPGRLTLRLPPALRRRSEGASWVVWQGDRASIPPANFRVSFREPAKGYPTIAIGGTRGQTQLLECTVPTGAGIIHVAIFTIAWLDGRPDRQYVVAYWELLPGLPVQVFASGVGPTVQPEFLASLRSVEYSDQ